MSSIELADVGSVLPTSKGLENIAMRTVPTRVKLEKGFSLNSPLLNLNTLPGFVTEFYDIETQMHVLHCMVGDGLKDEPEASSSCPTFFYDAESVQEKMIYSFIDNLKDNRLANFTIENVPIKYRSEKLRQNLPPDFAKQFTPVITQNGTMSFFESVSISMFSNPFCARALHMAIIHNSMDNPKTCSNYCDLFGENFGQAVLNLSKQKPPMKSEILVLSSVTERRMNIFYFDQYGNFESGKYFDAKPCASGEKSDINLLKIGEQYYPLITNETIIVQTSTSTYANARPIERSETRKDKTDKDKHQLQPNIPDPKEKFQRPEGFLNSEQTFKNNVKEIPHQSIKQLEIHKKLNNLCITEDWSKACKLLKSKLEDKTLGQNTISYFAKNQKDTSVTSRLPKPLSDWTAIKTDKDGNCFYSAVSTAIIGDQTIGKLLKKGALIELNKNQKLRQRLVDSFGEEAAINNLTQDRAWAIPPNIYTISAVIRRRIIVFGRDNKNGQLNGTFYDAINADLRQSGFSPVCLFLDDDHFSTLVKNSTATTIPAVNYELQDFRNIKFHKERLRQHIYASTGRQIPTQNFETIELSDESETDIFELNYDVNLQTRDISDKIVQPQLSEKLMLKESVQNKSIHYKSSVIENPTGWNRSFNSLSHSQTDNNYDTEHYCSTCATTVVDDSLSGSQTTSVHKSFIQPVIKKLETVKTCTARMFNSINDELLEETLSRMSYEIVNLQGDKTAVEKYVKNIADGTQLWHQNLKNVWGTRKASKGDLKNRARTLHSLQKREAVRNVVKSMLISIGAGESISLYDKELQKKGWLTSNKNEETENCPEASTIENIFKTGDKPAEVHVNDTEEVLNQPLNVKTYKQEQKQVFAGQHSARLNKEDDDLEELNNFLIEQRKKEDLQENKPESDVEQQIGQHQSDVGIEALCSALQLDKSDLKYQPPMCFEIEIAVDALKDSFDFEKNCFKKYCWAKLVSEELTGKQKCCSFIARSTPQYNAKKNYPFCTMSGKCPCGMRFVVSIKETPVKGLPVKCSVVSEGIFHLQQDKQTSRPITGVDREKLEAEFSNCKPKKQYLRDLQHLSGLRVLHKNFRYKSSSVLKKIRSDVKIKKRTYKDKVEELNHLTEKFKDSKIPEGQLNGFVQSRNVTSGEFFIIMYNRNSLILHADQISKRDITIHIDATGGLCKKMFKKEVLLYVVHGVASLDSKMVSYPIGESLMESGTSADIANFLGKIKDSFIKLRPIYRFKPFAKMVVCDWSYAMIHGILKGLNVETIVDYLSRSWKFLNEGVPWDLTRSSVFICSSHLIKAVQRNLYQKMARTKENRTIVNLALKAVARLQECFTIKEFLDITRTFVRTFDSEYIDISELNTNVAVFELTKTFLHEKIQEEPEESSNVIDSTPGKLLRDHSQFFHAFKAIRDSEKASILEVFTDNLNLNPYFCPKVVEVIMNDKIPMWPFWSSAIQQKLGNTTFLRSTNASVESEFNIRKNVYHTKKNGDFIDYIQEAETYHNQRIREAVVKLSVSDKKFDYRKRKNAAEDAPEKWSKRKQKKAKHFSSGLIEKTITNENVVSSQHKADVIVGPKENECSGRKSEENVNADNNLLRSKVDQKLQNEEGNLKETDASEECNKVWNTDDGGNLIICSVVNKDGSITLRRKDLARALTGNQWLHSDIIDAYLSIRANKCNPFKVHITPSNYIFFDATGNGGLGSWVGSGAVKPPWIDIPHTTKYFLHPLNIHGNHWILLFFNTLDKICTIYDSLRGPKGSFSRVDLIKDIKNEVLKVFGNNSAAFLSANYLDSPWVVVFDEKNPIQSDSHACGVNVLVNAKHLLEDPTGYLMTDKIDVVKERETIIREILQTSEFGNAMLKEANGDFKCLTEIIVRNVELENLNFGN